VKLGPVMVDVAGLELAPDDIERLQHPQVGGVILFARNFAAPLQLIRLTQAIRELRSPQLVIAVDHEGGRVQRFKDRFGMTGAGAGAVGAGTKSGGAKPEATPAKGAAKKK